MEKRIVFEDAFPIENRINRDIPASCVSLPEGKWGHRSLIHPDSWCGKVPRHLLEITEKMVEVPTVDD